MKGPPRAPDNTNLPSITAPYRYESTLTPEELKKKKEKEKMLDEKNGQVN